MISKIYKVMVITITFSVSTFAAGGDLDFAHFAVQEGSQAHISTMMQDSYKPRWFKEEKFNSTLLEYIPGALADLVAHHGFFGKDDRILLDFEGATPNIVVYTPANLNAWLFNNVIKFIYTKNIMDAFNGLYDELHRELNSDRARGLFNQYFPTQDMVLTNNGDKIKLLGRAIQLRALTKYGIDFSEMIDSAVSDIGIYMSQLGLYDWLEKLKDAAVKNISISSDAVQIQFPYVISGGIENSRYISIVGVGSDNKLRIFRKEIAHNGTSGHYIYSDGGVYKQANFEKKSGTYKLLNTLDMIDNNDVKREINITAVISDVTQSSAECMHELLGEEYYENIWKNNLYNYKNLRWATSSNTRDIDISALMPAKKVELNVVAKSADLEDKKENEKSQDNTNEYIKKEKELSQNDLELKVLNNEENSDDNVNKNLSQNEEKQVVEQNINNDDEKEFDITSLIPEDDESNIEKKSVVLESNDNSNAKDNSIKLEPITNDSNNLNRSLSDSDTKNPENAIEENVNKVEMSKQKKDLPDMRPYLEPINDDFLVEEEFKYGDEKEDAAATEPTENNIGEELQENSVNNENDSDDNVQKNVSVEASEQNAGNIEPDKKELTDDEINGENSSANNINEGEQSKEVPQDLNSTEGIMEDLPDADLSASVMERSVTQDANGKGSESEKLSDNEEEENFELFNVRNLEPINDDFLVEEELKYGDEKEDAAATESTENNIGEESQENSVNNENDSDDNVQKNVSVEVSEQNAGNIEPDKKELTDDEINGENSSANNINEGEQSKEVPQDLNFTEGIMEDLPDADLSASVMERSVTQDANGKGSESEKLSDNEEEENFELFNVRNLEPINDDLVEEKFKYGNEKEDAAATESTENNIGEESQKNSVNNENDSDDNVQKTAEVSEQNTGIIVSEEEQQPVEQQYTNDDNGENDNIDEREVDMALVKEKSVDLEINDDNNKDPMSSESSANNIDEVAQLRDLPADLNSVNSTESENNKEEQDNDDEKDLVSDLLPNGEMSNVSERNVEPESAEGDSSDGNEENTASIGESSKDEGKTANKSWWSCNIL